MFQPTHPVWGATRGKSAGGGKRAISIHAPRVGCDLACPLLMLWLSNFNPRTPCGVRPNSSVRLATKSNFNPRTPCGVRLSSPGLDVYLKGFQSTHPVWGATSSIWASLYRSFYFNPRTPCGVRLETGPQHPLQSLISIHAPRVGCDFSWRSN